MSDTNSSAPAAVETQGQVEGSQVEGSEEPTTEEPVEAATTAPITPAEKKRIKQLQLKIDGQDVTEDLPFEIEEDQAEWMTKQLQLSKVSQKRMQQTAALESDVKKFVANMQSDLKGTLKQMGIDPRAFAAQVIEEELKLQALSPEQRKQQELETELTRLKDERKKEKEDLDKRELERLQQQEYERIDLQMTKALETSDLPKEPYVVQKIAAYMLEGLKHGMSVTPEEVLPLVRDDIMNELQKLVKIMGPDKAEQFIGKDILNNIRKKNLAKAKQTPGATKAAIKDVGQTKKGDDKPADKVSMKDFFKV